MDIDALRRLHPRAQIAIVRASQRLANRVRTGQPIETMPGGLFRSDAIRLRLQDAARRGLPAKTLQSLFRQYELQRQNEGGPPPGSTSIEEVLQGITPREHSGPKYLRGGGPSIVPAVPTARVICGPLGLAGFDFVRDFLHGNWRPAFPPDIFSKTGREQVTMHGGAVGAIPCGAIVRVIREQAGVIVLVSGLLNINEQNVKANWQYVVYDGPDVDSPRPVHVEGWMLPTMLERLT